jgi:hypothetical protein
MRAGPHLRRHAADFPAWPYSAGAGHQEWSGRNNRVALAALDATPSPSSVPIPRAST